MGSIMAMMATVYVLAAVINVVAVGPRVGVVLSIVGALAYQLDVWLEWAGVIPFAPDVPQLAALGPPSLGAVMLTCTLVTSAIVGPTAVVAWLVHGLRVANAQLESLSERDPLTDLYNRRYLLARMEMELLRVKRGHPLCLMMIDLDGFKKINDGQGHLRGDLLLKEISSALAAAVRMTDVVARYGGDEFALLLPDTDAEQAHVVAARVVTQVHGVGVRFDSSRPVTASLGIAQATPDDAVASLIRHADDNAYRAKKAGGNRVVA
jgi:diguanylate cyclase (GGDEF)-like protein